MTRVDELWYATACALALDRIDELRVLETGTTWVQSLTLETPTARVELFDDYRDRTVSFTAQARNEAERLRHQETLARAGYVLQRSPYPRGQPGWSDTVDTGHFAGRPGMSSLEQLGELFGALNALDAGRARLVADSGTDFRRGLRTASATRRVQGVGGLRRFAPVRGRVSVNSVHGRIDLWPRLGRQIPWLVRIDSPVPAGRFEAGASSVRWVHDVAGSLARSTTLAWHESGSSPTNRPLPSLDVVLRDLGRS